MKVCSKINYIHIWTEKVIYLFLMMVFFSLVAICWDCRADRCAGGDDRALYPEAGWGPEGSETGCSHCRRLRPGQQDGKSLTGHTQRHCVHCLTLHTLRDTERGRMCLCVDECDVKESVQNMDLRICTWIIECMFTLSWVCMNEWKSDTLLTPDQSCNLDMKWRLTPVMNCK